MTNVECVAGRDTHHYHVELLCEMCSRYYTVKIERPCLAEGPLSPFYPLRRVACKECELYLSMSFFCSPFAEETEKMYIPHKLGHYTFRVMVKNIDGGI